MGGLGGWKVSKEDWGCRWGRHCRFLKHRIFDIGGLFASGIFDKKHILVPLALGIFPLYLREKYQYVYSRGSLDSDLYSRCS